MDNNTIGNVATLTPQEALLMQREEEGKELDDSLAQGAHEKAIESGKFDSELDGGVREFSF